MEPTIAGYATDYQGSALYGNAPNTSAINPTLLNPTSAGPSDWTSVLTNGISQAAVNGINGAVNNAVQGGAIQNALTAQAGGLVTTPGGTVMIQGSLMPLLLGAAVFMILMKV